MLKDGHGEELDLLDQATLANLLAKDFLRFMTDNEGRIIVYNEVTYVVWKSSSTDLNYNKWDDAGINLTYWCGGDILQKPLDGEKVWVYEED